MDLDIEEIESSIGNTSEALKQAEKEYKTQKKLLENRLKVLYEAGETTYLDVLLKSQSLSDFISNYFLISEVAAYDNDLLETLEKDRNKIEATKDALEVQQRKIKAMKEENELNKAMISNMQIIKTSYMNKLTEEEKLLQEKIDIYDTEMKQIANDIIIMTNLNIDYIGGVMAWPAPGYAGITSSFGYRFHPILKVNRLHSGTDIGAPMSAPVIAANDGVVIQSTYNSAYGNMIMIDHGGGIVTLYGHASELIATVGQIVKRGDIIMKVGSTGWSTGPHLHFEIRINGECVDPITYLTYNSKKSDSTSGNTIGNETENTIEDGTIN